MPPVNKDTGGSLDARKPAGFLTIAARIEVHDRHAFCTEIIEQALIARAGLVQATRGRNDDQVGLIAAGHLHEPL